MDVLDKLFGWYRKKEDGKPDIRFGRYSDNNKSVEKVARWNDAEQLFKERRFAESIDAFMDYLRDDHDRNVFTERDGDILDFQIYQGSKVVRGKCTPEHLVAEVSLARMPEPMVPVMRRLLELNFTLYYCRYALDKDRLCMRFETTRDSANPNKLYYGLKELAIRSDKQDDLLLDDFHQLEPMDQEHVQPMPDKERGVKCRHFRKFIREELDFIAGLDPDKLSTAVSYLLLTLAYRLDYLIGPVGILQQELEKVITIFYGREDMSVLEKNSLMIAAFSKLVDRTDEEISFSLSRSVFTFSISAPQPLKVVSDSLHTSIQNMLAFREAKQYVIAQQILEYGFSFCQFSYSLPRPMTELYQLFMQVNHPDYFRELGFPISYYDKGKNAFNKDMIDEDIQLIIESWKGKYPGMAWKKQNIRYDSLLNFNHSFINEVQNLNLVSPT